MNEYFQINVVFGTVSVEQRYVPENGRLHHEGRRVTRDSSGAITTSEWSRTGGSVGWDDGSAFTERDFRELANGRH